jgi:transposase-like protein
VAVKTKSGGFANESCLLKHALYRYSQGFKKMGHPVQNWNLALSQLAIHFEERVELYLAL